MTTLVNHSLINHNSYLVVFLMDAKYRKTFSNNYLHTKKQLENLLSSCSGGVILPDSEKILSFNSLRPLFEDLNHKLSAPFHGVGLTLHRLFCPTWLVLLVLLLQSYLLAPHYDTGWFHRESL